MSLEGDFDDVDESFFAFASSSFNDLSSAVSDSTSARKSAMMTPLSLVNAL